jgi:hypothetical protein
MLMIAALTVVLVAYCLVKKEEYPEKEMLQAQLEALHNTMVREDHHYRQLIRAELERQDRLHAMLEASHAEA